MTRRQDVEQAYYQIFIYFNKCLNDFDTDRDVIKFDVKPRSIDLEAIERANYVKNNQQFIKSTLHLSSPQSYSYRGRPSRKIYYSHPSLYGF